MTVGPAVGGAWLVAVGVGGTGVEVVEGGTGVEVVEGGIDVEVVEGGTGVGEAVGPGGEAEGLGSKVSPGVGVALGDAVCVGVSVVVALGSRVAVAVEVAGSNVARAGGVAVGGKGEGGRGDFPSVAAGEFGTVTRGTGVLKKATSVGRSSSEAVSPAGSRSFNISCRIAGTRNVNGSAE